MKTLVLAEKPSVAKDIARVLKCPSSGGCYENKQYVITWALGHLVTLADPEKYNERYKTWQLNDLPMLPEKMELVVIRQTAKQYNTVKKLLERSDVNAVIIATDAGREGELVARWILEKAKIKKPIRRLWISSVTDKAILEGFRNLKDGKNYVNLYHCAQARAISDWLVGINATRALTTKFNAQLSCGRVQTPTLAIIQAVEDSIQRFRPQSYYGISLSAGGVSYTWRDKKTNSTRTFDKNACDALLEKLKGQELKVTGIEKRMKKTYSPRLYDLTELQRDASRMYGYSPKETLNIMQSLYERHKVLTYPRTDSRYLSSHIVPTIPERLRTIPGELGRIAFKISKTPIKANENFVNDKKVTDHHAIIPTEQTVFFDDFNDREKKIYTLVARRFLSVLLPPCEYEEVNLQAECGGEGFYARGKRIVSAGFRELSGSHSAEESTGDENEIQEQTLPEVKKGSYKPTALRQTTGQTKPPKHLTEATLLTAMENPSKYVEIASGKLKETLAEAGGLGTVATRADIIEKLFDSFVMEKRGNDIYITAKGKQLLTLVPKDLKQPELTARWEQQLTKIANGQQSKEAFIADIKEYTKKLIQEIKTSTHQYRHENVTNQKCPDCGKNLLEVKGKRGKMLVCPDRECGHRKSLSLVTNARCPNCHKKMEMTGDGEHKRFVCACGYSEKLTAFQERREREGKNVSKKDVQSYLRQQEKSEKKEKPEINSGIADALKGLRFD